MNPPLRADAQRNRARILAAAEEVFAAKGSSASVEEVAALAGLAIGTIFRHFPTKQALLQAIMKDLLANLTQEATELATTGDPDTALFGFFTHLVEQAASKKTVVDLLANQGTNVDIASSVHILRDQLADLLTRAQQANAIRADIGVDEVIALLTSACHGALHAGWTPELRQRTLAVIFDGLRA